MYRYDFDENIWVELNETLRDSVSHMRGDLWNDKFYMTEGLLGYGSGSTNDDFYDFYDFYGKVQVYDFQGHVQRFNFGGRDNIEAMGATQCVYNNDTLVSIGGFGDGNEYYNDLFILGS